MGYWVRAMVRWLIWPAVSSVLLGMCLAAPFGLITLFGTFGNPEPFWYTYIVPFYVGILMGLVYHSVVFYNGRKT
jgi:hypothetical protein